MLRSLRSFKTELIIVNCWSIYMTYRILKCEKISEEHFSALTAANVWYIEFVISSFKLSNPLQYKRLVCSMILHSVQYSISIVHLIFVDVGSDEQEPYGVEVDSTAGAIEIATDEGDIPVEDPKLADGVAGQGHR